MSEEIDARLLKGALATVHKALEATGFDDSQALDLYAPVSVPVMREDPGIAESAPTEPDDNGSTVVAFTGSLAGEDSGDSHSASIGTETGPDEAVAQDEQANTNETAAELFGSMPWESSGPGESSSATDAVTKTASTDNCNVQISLDESAEKLFSSSKWGTAKPGASSEQIADAPNPPDNGGSKTGLLPEETAEELFAAMPWEPNEASSSPATSKAPNQSGTEGGENKAGAFLLDMPWEESTEPADEGATHAQSKHATKSGSEETAAQDFFENLDWDGTPKPADERVERAIPEAPETELRDEHVSIDPGDGEEAPEHVLRIMGLRESEQVPTPTDDAVRRSELSDDSNSSDEYDPFTGDNT